jgi:hypothetical protein
MNSIWNQTRTLVAMAILPLAAACGVTTDATDDSDENVTVEGEERSDAALTGSQFKTPNLSPDERDAVLAKYADLDPNHVIPKSLLTTAILYFDTNKSVLKNTRYLTVVDFSAHSGKHRFFIVDTNSGAVEPHVVAHGSGSDPNNTGYAKKFSNVDGSNASSLGFYATGETYDGKHGRSLRLDGLSSTNSNVRERAVVIHGASYVSEGRSQQGRSWGCLALPENAKDAVIDKLKGVSLIYAGLPQ